MSDNKNLSDAGKRKAEMDRRIREYLVKEIGEFIRDTGLNVSGVSVYMRPFAMTESGIRHVVESVTSEIE